MNKILKSLTVFRVETPNAPGNWMGKVLTAYLNTGFVLATGQYLKGTVEDINDSSVGFGRFILRTGTRLALMPLDTVTLPVTYVKAGAKAIQEKIAGNEETDIVTAKKEDSEND